MSASLFYRIAAGLLVFFALAHTAGMQSTKSPSPEAYRSPSHERRALQQHGEQQQLLRLLPRVWPLAVCVPPFRGVRGRALGWISQAQSCGYRRVGMGAVCGPDCAVCFVLPVLLCSADHSGRSNRGVSRDCRGAACPVARLKSGEGSDTFRRLGFR